jgi:L-alanine-DL-glutamate epimerase-like enolase superfamily enzyme
MISRKKFIQNLGISSLAMAMPTTSALAQEKQEKKEPVKSGVKITNVIAFSHPRASYVKIETDAGTSGWGEGDHEFTAINGKIVEDVLKPVLIGQDPFDSEYLWEQMFFAGFEGGSTGFVPGAVAGVDNALCQFQNYWVAAK